MFVISLMQKCNFLTYQDSETLQVWFDLESVESNIGIFLG